jgi:hypothetical protein
VPSNFIQSVAYGGGQFVAVGDSGTIIRSSDGQIWNPSTSGSTSYLTGVTYFGGKFYVAGQSGTLLSSADAVTWAPENSGTAWWIKGLGGSEDTLVAGGDNGTLLTSPDGSSFTAQSSGVSASINAVVYSNGAYVAVGAPNGSPLRGLILKSGDVVQDDGSFEVWRSEEFTEAELADPSISGPDADPDCDGESNFSEYAVGRDPKVADADGYPRVVTIDDAGTGRLAIEFRRPEDRLAFVVYEAEQSGDLAIWDAFGGVEEILGTDSDGIQTVRVTDLEGLSDAFRNFVRLTVSGG